MFSSLFAGTTIPVLEQVVNFAQARHEVLAGNIANCDTPGYRTRDLNTQAFQKQLSQAIETSHTASSPSLAPQPSGPDFHSVRDSLKSILYHDETNVGMEQQVMEINKNQMLHNLSMTVLTSQFQLLGAAISERV